MSEDLSQTFLSSVTARQGHFLLESGYHSQLWFDLDGLFKVLNFLCKTKENDPNDLDVRVRLGTIYDEPFAVQG